MERVWMYVDGFNVYYCIKENKRIPVGLGWCDFRKLGEGHLIGPNAHLEKIKYFTTIVEPHLERNPGETERQNVWLLAAQSIEGLTVIEGSFLPLPNSRTKRREKLTDVNIAVELLLDALDIKGYDRAILITADSDLAPAVMAVQSRLAVTRLVNVWLPPGASDGRWRLYGKRHDPLFFKHLKPEMLASSLLPYKIGTPQGVIKCPPYWQVPQP